MKVRTYFSLIILLLYSTSCIKNDKAENDTYSQYKVEKRVYDISKSILLENKDAIQIKKIIKLSVDSKVPLGCVDKLIIAEDRVFILDRTFSRYLFIYDSNGILLAKIGDKGQGPGEYFDGPKDFYIDDKNKQITVFESQSKMINTYDWNGNIINNRRLANSWPYSFAKKDSFYYFAYKTIDKNSYLLQVEDENENVYEKYKKLNKKRDVVKDNCFYVTAQQVYFVEDYNNDVVVLKDGNIHKFLSFDFGENSISKDFLSEHKGKEFIKNALSNHKATNIANIVETNNLFSFQFSFQKMLYQVIQSKENGNYLCGVALNSFNFPGLVFTNFGDELVTVLTAELLDHLLNLKQHNVDEWNKLLVGTHPAIRKILQASEAGQTDDYIIIYNLML